MGDPNAEACRKSWNDTGENLRKPQNFRVRVGIKTLGEGVEIVSKRVFAEAMYRTNLWQVLVEDLETEKISILHKNLQNGVAVQMAERLQEEFDREDEDGQRKA